MAAHHRKHVASKLCDHPQEEDLHRSSSVPATKSPDPQFIDSASGSQRTPAASTMSRFAATLVSAVILGLGSSGCSADVDQAAMEDFDSLGSALTITSSHQTGFVGDWFYTHWKDGGTASQTLNADGTFSVSWQGGNYNYVGGPGWNHGLNNRVIGYNFSSDSGASYIALYGWSMNPLVEYYVLQRWSYDPTAGASQGATFTSNGVQYTAYRTQRVSKPSINGTQTFYQYWSKPTSQRALGQNHEIKFADHAAAWASSGWNLGNMQTNGSDDPTYQVIAVEVFGPPSSGTAAGRVWNATPVAATCTDGVQNQGETGVDCGGPCSACAAPTCSDGIQNQSETGVDCGGPCSACTVPEWSQSGVGSTSPAGSYTVSNGTYSVKGSGADIYGTTDAFHYVYKQVTGDATIIARATSLTNTNQWAKAGVMFRESLSANSTFAMMQMRPDGYLQNQHRASTGASTGGAASTVGTAGAPKWLKVERVGNTFTMAYSSNGTSWTQAASQTIAMPNTIYVGLVSCSHANGTLATAVFDNVSVANPGACTPATTCSGGAQCGTQPNGCGGTISCGSCGSGSLCNTSSNMCEVCVPNTCASLGAECGSVSDGCGGTLSCGSCPTDYSCGANLCSCTAVAAPAGMSSSGADGQATISWNAVAGAMGYTVKRSTTSGSGYTTVANVTSTNHVDMDLINGTTYHYVVTANTSCGSSSNSAQTSVTPSVACVPTTCAALGATCGSVSNGCGGTLSCGSCGAGYACNVSNSCECGAVSAASGVTATAGNAQAVLSWNPVSGASSYEVKRSTTSGSGYTTVATVTTTSYTNSGLTNGTTYYYVIVANSVCGSSANSTQVSTVPAAASNCTCATGCGSVVTKSAPFTPPDGTHEGCYFFSGSMGNYVNSWNLNASDSVNINGTNYKNVYVGSGSYPAKRDNGYYLYYKSTNNYAHMEVK